MRDEENEPKDAPHFDPSTSALPEVPGSVREAAKDAFKLYTSGGSQDLQRILEARYTPDATFTDHLVSARGRSSIGLQFYSLHRTFSSVEVEPHTLRAVRVGEGQQAGLWQVTVDNTQRLTFSRTTKISQQVLPEDAKLEVTTTLLIDPQLGQVVRHEDVWRNVPVPRLPMLWRRLNAGWTNMMFRWLGWGRDLQQGCAGASGLGRE